MSKFINTHYKNTVNSLVEGLKDKMKNPYYIFTDSKPTIVTYFNINTHKSSLDNSLEITYSNLGKDSSLKFNKIKDFYLYGIDKITTELDVGEFGVESSSIEGEATILPNTIVPIPNDYFIINYESNKLLFKVTSVTSDTIENGVNFYKINYKMDQIDSTQILDQIVDEYTMIINNVGTNFKAILKLDEFNFIEKLDEVNIRLKQYYKYLFYSERTQTFIFKHNGSNFYDSYLIEFLKRNDVLDGNGEYLYIEHQLPLNNTFPLDYDKTIFRFVEFPDLTKKRPLIYAQGKYIDNPVSIFLTRIEDYYRMVYARELVNKDNYLINVFDAELMDRIFNHNIYNEKIYKNIFIKYFNNLEISPDDIYSIEDIEFDHNKDLFYQIPILIYIIDKKITKLLKNKGGSKNE